MRERLLSKGRRRQRMPFMAPPELTAEQEKFLARYLETLDYEKIDVEKLLRDLITTQLLRNPDSPHGGGKYDVWCAHNRTLSYALEDAEKDDDILSILDLISKKEEP